VVQQLLQFVTLRDRRNENGFCDPLNLCSVFNSTTDIMSAVASAGSDDDVDVVFSNVGDDDVAEVQYTTVEEFGRFRLDPVGFSIRLKQFQNIEDEFIDYFKKYYLLTPVDEKGKRSYNYLLVDPSVVDMATLKRMYSENNSEALGEFQVGVFYVGKGTGDRAFSHCIGAKKFLGNINTSPLSITIKNIINLWRCGLQVVVLKLNQNLSHAEAFSREASMISALGGVTDNLLLSNIAPGHYSGEIHGWKPERKESLGTLLVWKAIATYIENRERGLLPEDV
jgi:hypothetical protein